MPRPILFAVGQAGSAEYLIPLWRRWLAREGAASWRVAAAPVARERVTAAGLGDVRFVPFEDGELSEAESDGWQPAMVVASASGADIETAAVALVRRRGLPLVRFIDAWYGYRRRLEPGGPLDPADRILVIDDEAVEEALAEGLPREMLEPVGHPAWEEVTPLPPADRRRVMFVSQPVARHYGGSLGYTESESWEMLRGTAQAHPELIERLIFAPHPEESLPPPAEDGLVRVATRAREALGEAGTVVGMFSSLLIHALLAGRHVVSLQPGAVGPDLTAMGRRGWIARATSEQELVAALAAPTPPCAALRRSLEGSCARLERALLAAGHG